MVSSMFGFVFVSTYVPSHLHPLHSYYTALGIPRDYVYDVESTENHHNIIVAHEYFFESRLGLDGIFFFRFLWMRRLAL